MARPTIIDIDDRPRSPQSSGGGLGLGGWFLFALVLLASSRTLARWWIDYMWWTEVGQAETYVATLLFSVLPGLVATAVTFVVFAFLYRRATRHYKAWHFLGLLVLAFFLNSIHVDNWVVARWWGASNAPTDSWRDPVFGNPVGFYFFTLPFLRLVLGWLQGVLIFGFLLYWVTSRFGTLREKFYRMQQRDGFEMEFGFSSAFDSIAVRVAIAAFFVLLAARAYFSRYDILFEDHGFMVGADYVANRFVLPLVLALTGACILAAVLALAKRTVIGAVIVTVAYLASGAIPRIINAISVRPNEISLQRPYITQHINATRTAYGLGAKLKERDYPAQTNTRFDRDKHKDLLDNVRLWDWGAFHDTVTQIQALRPYYVFSDTDVDRYTMPDGKTRQLLLTPRELDVRQLPDANSRWINPHFIYTHGYGVVMAEANRIAADGLPELLVKDAPLVARADAPKISRPEIYFGETTHEPVFVNTAQPEFNYPSGSDNVHSKYEGKGGIPITSLPMRFAAAVAEGDWNILLTTYLTGDSRMLIRRKVAERVDALAEFVAWDADPYLVVGANGRLVWMIDGYTTHNMHPYSTRLRTQYGRVNYIRNSVKATIDAYDGTVTLYSFDDNDPILNAYRRIFPRLFAPASAMPADLRAHARYPETLFRIQAEMYRTYHMTDPESFYNKEDQWDLARTAEGPDNNTRSVAPTYLMTTLPGDTKPEFILLTTFTPRNKQNLIGLLAARCDGERLGELEVLKLSKQQLIFGPMQVSARINQDQEISKDLTLWNQQGSTVIKGQMLVLPLTDQFLYVEPIYIKAKNAPMPELKKVALGFGSSLAYANTYDEAIAQLAGVKPPEAPQSISSGAQPPPAPSSDPRMDRLKSRLKRYRDLMGQGKYVDAARELEALESELKE